jgi:hypothetical protein
MGPNGLVGPTSTLAKFEASRAGRWLRRAEIDPKRWAVLALTVLAVEVAYVFVVSAGRFEDWPYVIDYYDLLVEAFRAGKLHVAIEPSAELMAQSDPYDLRHLDLALGDASLHNGKYYMYWGPVPALLQAAAKEVLGVKGLIGDQYLLFVFQSLVLVSMTILLERTARRLFPQLPLALLVFAIIGFGLANPALYLLAWARMYEDAIIGAQAFALLGLVFAAKAVFEARWRDTPRWLLLAIGGSWALSIGCRASLGPALATTTLFTALATSAGDRARLRRLIHDGLWITLPIAAGVFGLLLYNKLRFEAWFDFGMEKQITIWPFRFSARYLLPNAASYFLRLPELTCEFPFVAPTTKYGSSFLSRWFADVRGYVTPEQLVGMWVAVPLVWPAPVAIYAAFRGARSALFVGPEALVPTVAQRNRVFVWLVACALALVVLPVIGPWGIRLATMRYLGDVTNGWALLGVLGWWRLCSAETSLVRRASRPLGVALVTFTAIMGMLLGYQGYSVDFFKVQNPELDAKLKQTLSLCR